MSPRTDDARRRLESEAEQTAEALSSGPTRSTPAGPLTERSLTAFAVFIVAFLIVFFVLWAAFGGWGIILGVIVGILVGAFSVKLVADRAASGRS